MKKLLLVCALLVSAVSFSNAQGQGGQGGFNQGTPEERAQRTLDGMVVASLNLTVDQKAKALPLLVAYNKATTEMTAKAQAAGGDMQAAMTELRPKMTALAEENEKLFVALLTADQKKTYDAALAAAKERNPAATTVVIGGRGGRGGQGQGGGAPAAPRPAGQ